ncbi:MAG: hypothetical protein JWR12_3179 [Mucilaginibacter sp.]|nr:hypothetical protein [Mucilaginibacter sp.]
MKIQVLSLSFYPDHSGIANYSSDFAFYAAERMHSVEVITGYPFYPQWRKRKEDRRKLFSTEYYNNVKILRGYIYVPSKPTLIKRLIQEFSLIISASVNFFRAQKPDVIVVFTTPISLGFLTCFFKKLYGCKLIINVQDFQLEAASSLGMANKKVSYKILSKIESYSYKHADLVTSISPSMYNILKHVKSLPENKIYLWPNWFESKPILKAQNHNNFRKHHNISDDTILIAYAGNIGVKQGLELLVDLAKLFENESKLFFLIIGEGAAVGELKSYAKTKALSNLKFINLLNQTEYIDFLNDLDVFFLPQKKTEFDVYFPSKLLSLLDIKKLVLLSADKDSELYKTFVSFNLGLVSEYGNIDSIYQLLNQILADRNLFKRFNQSAEEYVSKFHKEKVLDEVLNKMKTI